MNVDWKRGSDAYWVLNPDNHSNVFNDLTLRHIFEALDGEIECTEDKNKIIVKGNYIGHYGPELADTDLCIVRSTVNLPPGSDGFYTAKLTNDAVEPHP
jgi:hypothetical protein